MGPSLTKSIRSHALRLGFSAMGVAPARILEQDEVALLKWVGAGLHGEMAYMARDPKRRSRAGEILPGAQSVIVLAMNYYPPQPAEQRMTSPMGRVSRYAWGRDYHSVIEQKLLQLEVFIKSKAGPDVRLKSYVDHGPVLEKAHAREAGLGFIGKNTLLITEAFGSYVFLSVILTTLPLSPGQPLTHCSDQEQTLGLSWTAAAVQDLPVAGQRVKGQPQTSQCGGCRLCLDACPTGALTAPFELDARRCISYLTIEHKTEIPETLRPQMGDWVFGCDICQQVCPYNARPKPTAVKEFRSDHGVGPWLDLEKVMALDSEEEFRAAFHDTPLLRPKRAGLQRNAEALFQMHKAKSHCEEA